MKSLGMTLTGSLYVQRLETKPPFQYDDTGRVIYCVDSETMWIGAENEWVSITLYDGCIKSNHINWDIDQNSSAAVNSSKMPTYYNGNVMTVQEALDQIQADLGNIRNAKDMGEKVIMGRHINGASVDGFTAEDMYIRDLYGTFGGNAYATSVEQAIDIIAKKRANDIKLSKDSSLGSYCLGGPFHNIQEGLEGIEAYLNNLSGDQIKVHGCNLTGNESLCDHSDIQTALDQMCNYLSNLKLIDLHDTPNDYGACGQYLRTCGDGCSSCEGCAPGTMPKVHWSHVRASDVSCILDIDANYTFDDQYANSNVQTAIHRLEYYLKTRLGYLYYNSYYIDANTLQTITIDCSGWYAHAVSRCPGMISSDFYCFAIVETSRFLVTSRGPFSGSDNDLGDYSFVRYDISHSAYDHNNHSLSLTLGPTGMNDRDGSDLKTYSQRTRAGYYIHIVGGILGRSLINSIGVSVR